MSIRPQTIVERLDFVAKRISGLKFTPPTQLKPGDDQGYGCFMSCDMYYIEIKVDQSHQIVKDVIITHGNNGISCPVLKKVLADQDFETFAKHLCGLHSIYQIGTNDKKVKQRAYPALTALESDLAILYDYQRRRITNCHDLVHKSPIGVMECRKGGLPVKLYYFITPYDLIDPNQKKLINLNIQNIIDRNLGLSATVEIEGSNPHKLQVKPLISNQHNSSLPAYAPFNGQNSEKLPAQFVLKLSQPLPVLNISIDQIINDINEPSTIKEYLTTLTQNSKESLVSLIARQELDLNKGPFCRSYDSLKGADSDSCDLTKHVYTIKLLDQYHTYNILDNYLEKQEGVYITKIPFTHPTSIPSILKVLRQQALFNFVIGSCIRKTKSSSAGTYDDSMSKVCQKVSIFDIVPVNLNNICISFEHPSKESLATLEIDFKELNCQLYALDKEGVCSNEIATKVLQKCWSIPITLRSVLRKCDERRLALLEDANKRRERELQELLANNSAQQGLQFKSQIQTQETLLQSKFNGLNNIHDLNAMAEFLTAKVNNATTSDASNQTNTEPDDASDRSSLLKKFSCKPKTKQNTTTKNQTGNRILSLMLKRQNSSSSVSDDSSLKATLIKKPKTKNIYGEPSLENSSTTKTKLISTEAASAARFASKHAKSGTGAQGVSLSLIRSPNKSQLSGVSTSSNANINVNLSALGSLSTQKSSDTTNTSNIRLKHQPNGSSNSGKPRKSSIGAVLDRLVDGVTPEQSASLQQSNDASNEAVFSRVSDSSKSSPSGAKAKVRQPGDKFAIKQGSSGGLKLTVTKTKPAGATASSSSSTPVAMSSTTGSVVTNSKPASTTLSIPVTSVTLPSPSTVPSTTSGPSAVNKTDTSKILGLSSSTPPIKYTIPKLSKTQQAASGPSNQSNSADQNVSTNDLATNNDDTSNPSSSATPQSLPAGIPSLNRPNIAPVNRLNSTITNRNDVSSSTHPPGRTTSNPLAGASRPAQSNSGDNNHLLNRISSSNQGQAGMRLQMTNRVVNIQQQQQQLQQPIKKMINPLVFSAQQSQPVPMFAMALGQQQQQQQPQLQPQLQLQQQFQIQHLQLQPQQLQQQPQAQQQAQPQPQPQLQLQLQLQAQPQSQHQPQPQQGGVSSSSDKEPIIISTPSSPVECDHTETVPPPPLIPIDSIDDSHVTSPETDYPDDASDRLSIVDTNENIADSNSVSSTPKPSSVVSSPPTANVTHDSNSSL